MTSSLPCEPSSPGLDAEKARRKVALITGISGQDGIYLAELLLDKGYVVYGLTRRSSNFDPARFECLEKARKDTPRRLILCHGDMTNGPSLYRIIEEAQPDEVYNLAAQSQVAYSFDEPEYTADSDALGPLRMLEAIRKLGLKDKTRFYQASTSELFGQPKEAPQNELTPFHPCSPYAVAKLYAYWITINYRESYGMFASNGILFNHDSPLRRENFVTRKITRGLTRIALGMQQALYLGNLDARRDWGHARDYVEMQWLILQQDSPDDYVVATGRQHSVRDFVTAAAAELGMKLRWEGAGETSIGIVDDPGPNARVARGQTIVRVDPRHFRPRDADGIVGDPSKARHKLGWQPRTTFNELVRDMVRADLNECLRSLSERGTTGLAYSYAD